MSESTGRIPHVDWERVDEAALNLPESAEWLGYWRDLTAEHGAPPPRAALNLIGDHPKLAPLALWAERLPDGDFLFRLVGELVRHYAGVSLKNKKLSEIDLNGSEGFIARKYAAAVETGAPVCSRGRYNFGDREVAREAVVMPFAEADGGVRHLLIGMAFK
ncbi:MAG: hypothetical protein RIB45_04155 [Marivibrio sp.]|uniref:hypothetical protein n=1 Tax=Marivibrio sp. TaxID=2039719 RepID=UPI0032EB5A0B